jgi:hypothetical protein
MDKETQIPGQNLLAVYQSPEAYRFIDSVKNAQARGALGCVHQALLECYGFNFGLLAERIVPDEPIDLLVFAEAIVRTFTEWSDTLIERPSSPNIEQRILNKDKAMSYIDSLASQRARNALRNFVTHLFSMNVPQAGPKIDLFFCCRLLAACVADPQVLSSILDGSLAQHNDRLRNDYEYSLNAWFKQHP